MSSLSTITTIPTVQKSVSPSKVPTPTTDPGGGSVSTTDSDEVKVFGCEKHEEDVDVDGDANSDRLSPVIKEEEVRQPIFSYIKELHILNYRHHHNKDHQPALEVNICFCIFSSLIYINGYLFIFCRSFEQ